LVRSGRITANPDITLSRASEAPGSFPFRFVLRISYRLSPNNREQAQDIEPIIERHSKS
jgi:galactose mutarotase-like enzyme